MIMISVTLGQRPEVGFEEDRHEENKQTIHRYISSSSSVIFPFFFLFWKRQPLGRRKVAKVHMSNGKCATVLIAQEAEEAPSLEDKLEEGLLQYPKNNGLHDM